MTDKTLPERMREAADVLLEVVERDDTDRHQDAEPEFRMYSPVVLRTMADQWECEDAEKSAAEAALDAEVEELAKVMHRDFYRDMLAWERNSNIERSVYRKRARAVTNAGWRKQATP